MIFQTVGAASFVVCDLSGATDAISFTGERIQI
jgi:hypothetical protein